MSPLAHLPAPARVYVCAVIAGGATMAAIAIPQLQLRQPGLFLLLLLLSSMTSLLTVRLPLAKSGATMSVAYAIDFASLLVMGPHETMVIAVVGAWTQTTFNMGGRRNPLFKRLFSMSALALTVQSAGLAFRMFGGMQAPVGFEQLVQPLIGAAATYFVVNTGLVAGAIALTTRQSLLNAWSENFVWSAPSYFVGAVTAAVAVWLIYLSRLWVVPVTAAPLFMTYRTYRLYLGRIEDEQRHVKEISKLHLATIEALALAIDAKDQMSQLHIRRVQAYAAGLARVFGMSDKEVEGVSTAALLHDIGKLAVPEHILSKPGPLTEEEFRKIRAHPEVGAAIIGAVPFPYPVAPLILCHHERWDGKGYPRGLKGDEIPLGARILTVVDYFDAITAERPYHKAMSVDKALDVLREEAGRALDPRIVTTFISLLPALSAEAAAREFEVPTLPVPTGVTGATAPATGLLAAASQNVFQNIARAHREIYALYELAQVMGTSLSVRDTMTLISSKLSNLMPLSGSSLHLYDEAEGVLRCRFAAGPDVQSLENAVTQIGTGLSGWVACNRQPLVNARPSAEFEASGLFAPGALKSSLAAPLIFDDRLIGVLVLYDVQSGSYNDDHRGLLDRICQQASAVICNAIVFEQTQEDSLTDVLTGLPNTRSLFMHLEGELARAWRQRTPLAVLVMDVDNFKQINDTFGHEAGDRALREIAGVLRHSIRPYDICVRYAGDEFIAVLVDCDQQEAEARQVQLQKRFGTLAFQAKSGRRIEISMSIGCAVFPHDGREYETLIAAADTRMYESKARRKAARVGVDRRARPRSTAAGETVPTRAALIAVVRPAPEPPLASYQAELLGAEPYVERPDIGNSTLEVGMSPGLCSQASGGTREQSGRGRAHAILRAARATRQRLRPRFPYTLVR
jgi:diguanylate cyclase (GGDEF)-like protein